MARTTKVVNKRTTGSKNSNTNNGKGFFGKSFDLKSRKVQFFVVILIVAILGGGYFTFKSFASTASATFMPADLAAIGPNGSRGSIVTELQPGAKKNKQVYESWGGGSHIVPSSGAPNSYAIMDPVLKASRGKQSRICLFARGVEGNVGIRISTPGITNPSFVQDFIFGPDYSLQCTNPFITDTKQIDLFGVKAGYIQHMNIGGAKTYRIGYLTFEVL